MMWSTSVGAPLLTENLALLLVFATIYKLLWTLDDTQFSQTRMTWVDSVYFAMCTQSTVGYGEYHPRSSFAKICVTIHIGLTVYINLIRPISRSRAKKLKTT